MFYCNEKEDFEEEKINDLLSNLAHFLLKQRLYFNKCSSLTKKEKKQYHRVAVLL